MAKTIPCFWISGLQGSGKTTLAQSVVEHLRHEGVQLVWLDGDAIRAILPQEMGYSREERIKVAKFYSNLAKLNVEQGIAVVVSTVSLFNEIHSLNAQYFKNFHFIKVDVPLEELTQRNKKSLYSNGQMSATPEWPKDIQLNLNNTKGKQKECEEQLFEYIKKVLQKSKAGSHAA